MAVIIQAVKGGVNVGIFCSKGIEIVAISAAVPCENISKSANSVVFGSEVVDKFIKTTGIESRYITSEKQTASDLGFEAAVNILEKLNINRSEIGIIIYTSLSPDYRRPSTSCVLQMRLGLPKDCAALDIGHGCAGFVYGNQVMLSMMSTTDCRYGLLICGDTLSKLQDKTDHLSMMFGDAASAILYERNADEKSSIRTLLGADGSRYKAIFSPGGGFRYLDESPSFKMDGMEVFAFSTQEIPGYVLEFLSYTGTSADEYDCVVLHQANKSILRVLAKALAIPEEKVPISLDRYGNTSSASIPLTICDRYGSSPDTEKIKVLACGFGVGLAWGVTSFSIKTENIFSISKTGEYFEE